MRFKKGSRVEVLCNRGVPSGEWRSAKIISGNGHTYCVQCDCSSMTSDAVVERVPRKSIRPCPPLVEGVESWAANDVVEIYDVSCWKRAVVSKFLGGDFYLLRLLGSPKEFKVHKFDMRVCKTWQDDQWVVMQKCSVNAGVGKSSRNLRLNRTMVTPEVQLAGTGLKQRARNDCLLGKNGSSIQESCLVSSTTLKRASPYCSFPVEAYPRKKKSIMNIGECQRFVLVSSPPLLEKVDPGAYPCKYMGVKCIHTSFNNGTTQYCEMGRENPNKVATHFLERIEEPNDSSSDICSVGSCSVISNGSDKFFTDMVAGPCQDADTLCSDAEALDVGDEEERCPLLSKEYVAARIHRLELHAYRSSIEAIYASGPLSWEQEAELTNRRILLHISNDEHLMEIRNLISSAPRF